MSEALAVAVESEVAAELPDPEVGRVVARMWQNHLRLDSTLLNSEGRVQEAGHLVRQALPNFDLYCQAVPGIEGLLNDLQSHGSEVKRSMEGPKIMGWVDVSRKSLKSDRDFRVNKRTK